MEIPDIINTKELSRTLTTSDNSIRKNKCPKKYQRKVDVLIYLIARWEAWANKHKCKN